MEVTRGSEAAVTVPRGAELRGQAGWGHGEPSCAGRPGGARGSRVARAGRLGPAGAELRGLAGWGQRERGAAGHEDRGGSEILGIRPGEEWPTGEDR